MIINLQQILIYFTNLVFVKKNVFRHFFFDQANSKKKNQFE